MEWGKEKGHQTNWPCTSFYFMQYASNKGQSEDECEEEEVYPQMIQQIPAYIGYTLFQVSIKLISTLTHPRDLPKRSPHTTARLITTKYWQQNGSHSPTATHCQSCPANIEQVSTLFCSIVVNRAGWVCISKAQKSRQLASIPLNITSIISRPPIILQNYNQIKCSRLILYLCRIYSRYRWNRFSFTRYCFTFYRAVKTANSRFVVLDLMAEEMAFIDSFHLFSYSCRNTFRSDCWHFSLASLSFVSFHLPLLSLSCSSISPALQSGISELLWSLLDPLWLLLLSKLKRSLPFCLASRVTVIVEGMDSVRDRLAVLCLSAEECRLINSSQN